MNEVFYPGSAPMPDPSSPEPAYEPTTPDLPRATGRGVGSMSPPPRRVREQRRPSARIGGRIPARAPYRPPGGIIRAVGPGMNILVGVVGVIADIAILVIGHQLTLSHRAYPGGVDTSGTVISVSSYGNSNNHPAYLATVEFTEPTRQRGVFTQRALNVRPLRGGLVPVSYPQGDPGAARWVQSGSTTTSVTVGVAFVVFGLAIVGTGIRLRRRLLSAIG